jgi:hypothetical protein
MDDIEFWDVLQSVEIKVLERDALQQTLPSWGMHTKTWAAGGCFILARGMQIACQEVGLDAELWGLWNNGECHHVYLKLDDLYYAADEIADHWTVLDGWGSISAGLHPVSAEEAKEERICVDETLSRRIASCFLQRV